MTASPPGTDRGQATVEVALLVPVVALLALMVVQVAVVVRAQLLVVHAAREAARVAAVDDQPDRLKRVAAVAGLDAARMRVDAQVSTDGRSVTVEVAHRLSSSVPLIGPAIGDLTLRERVTMHRE